MENRVVTGNIFLGSGFRRRSLRAVISAIVLTVSAHFAASASNAADTVDTLIEKARELKLSESTYWRVLMHYHESAGGWESEIDDPRFFLAPDGKRNPSAELDATIRTIFSGNESPESLRFTGRYEWLMRTLRPEGLRNAALDGEVGKVIARFDPGKMTVLFSDEYPGAIESAFGHVFLGVYPREGGDAKKIVLNYAGDMRKDPYYLVPFKGLFGGYRGKYSIQDYDRKVTGYGKNEKRTVWEYDMNCTREEIERVVLHLQELDTVYCNFYFLDENCSQKLQSLMQPARPDMTFRRPFLYLSPIETVESLRDHGFIDADSRGRLVYDPDVTDAVEPHLRHGYSRLSASGGSGHDGAFCGVSFLPLYNSMYDANPGMKPGFQLAALGVAARYYPGEDNERRASVERLTLCDLLVMNMSKTSGACTRVRIEGNRFAADDDRPFSADIRFGRGKFAYSRSAGIFYATADADLRAYRSDGGMKGCAGPGAAIGMSSDWLCVKTTIEAEAFYYVGSSRRYIARVSCVNSINLSKYFSLHVKGFVSRIKDATPYEAEGGIDFYF